MLESDDTTSKSKGPIGESSGERLLADANSGVDVVNHLRINDPGKVMMPEVYGMPPEDVCNMLEGFDIVKPKDFMNGVHLLADRAKEEGVPLNKEFMAKIAEDPMIGNQESGAAHVMSGNIREFASDPGKTGFTKIGRLLKPESNFQITADRVSQMDDSAAEIENSRIHPEMRDSKQLAKAAESLLAKNNGRLTEPELRNIARSHSYTPEERAAATMLRLNYPVFAGLAEGRKLGREGADLVLDGADITVLSKLEKNNGEAKADAKEAAPGCDKQSLGWAATFTALPTEAITDPVGYYLTRETRRNKGSPSRLR